MSCMRAAKAVARAETAMLCSRLLLERIEKGASKASPQDVRAGIITAAGILSQGIVAPGDPLENSFLKVSRSIKPLGNELAKLEKLSTEQAAKFRGRVDRLIKKVGAFWPELEKSVCREKE